MTIDDNTFPAPDDPQQETLGEAFADYLDLVEETIRTQITDDHIRAKIRQAMDRAASRDNQPKGLGELGSRRELLEELQALMDGPRRGPVVLAGPSGTGKTTTAAALAKHAQTLNLQVWWISAADPVTMSQGLRTVAKQLGGARDIEVIARGGADAADRFWRMLNNADSRWLLVFDEADDPRVLAAATSPAGVQDLTGWWLICHGLALVTSRETDPRMWQAAQLRTIGELQEADATRRLLELAPSAGDADQARALARSLESHSLSLRLAGSYLRSRAAQGATFAAYERALSEEADRYTGEHQTTVPAQTLTARTLELSLDGLARQGMPQTRPVLELASCYASTTIPASLLNAEAVTGVLASLGDSSSIGPGGADEALRMLKHIGIFEPAQGGITCTPPSPRLAGPAWAAGSPVIVPHPACRDRTPRHQHGEAAVRPAKVLAGVHAVRLAPAEPAGDRGRPGGPGASLGSSSWRLWPAQPRPSTTAGQAGEAGSVPLSRTR